MSINFFGKIIRQIPSTLPGRNRLTRLLTKPFIGSRPVVFESNGFIFHVPSLLEPVAFGLWTTGAYEQDVQEVILSYWKNDIWFVDIGANIGALSIPLSRSHPHNKVLSIEASPCVSPYLRENISRNQCLNINSVEYAVCDQEGLALDFNEAPDSKFGMGSLGTSFGSAPVEVVGRTLDGILEDFGFPRVSVVKVDVEGYEAAVFDGSKRLLAEQRPIILFEFCDWAERNSKHYVIGQGQEILGSSD